MPLVDYKNHKEGMPYELKFPFRPTTTNNNNAKWPRTSSSPQTRAAGTGGTLIKAPPSDFSDRNSAAIPRSVSSDGRPLNPKRSQNQYDAVMKLADALSSQLSAGSVQSAFNNILVRRHRCSPGNDNYALACSIAMGRTMHNTDSPSYTDAMSSNQWRQKSMPDG